jgi:23S rRNA pseudouridine2605 synthase
MAFSGEMEYIGGTMPPKKPQPSRRGRPGAPKRKSPTQTTGQRTRVRATSSKRSGESVKPPHVKKKPIPEGSVRIQKYLAERGIASRRAIEEMVQTGLVDVNGQTIMKLPCFVNPEEDEIVVDGKRIRAQSTRHVYFLLSKPRGVVCSSSDPDGRTCAVDLIPKFPARLYCVGRLDVDSTGLILLTNDGELTQHLTHPRYEVSKTYLVTVTGQVTGDDITKLKAGLYIDGRRTAGAGVKVVRRGDNSTLLEMTLREGRNREIRRLLARLGHKVRRLTRTAIGPIKASGLSIGNFRPLTLSEIRALRRTGKCGKSKTSTTRPRRANTNPGQAHSETPPPA